MEINPLGKPAYVPPTPKVSPSVPPRTETAPPKEAAEGSLSHLSHLVQQLREMPEIRPEKVQEAREKLADTGLLTDDAVNAIINGLPALRDD